MSKVETGKKIAIGLVLAGSAHGVVAGAKDLLAQRREILDASNRQPLPPSEEEDWVDQPEPLPKESWLRRESRVVSQIDRTRLRRAVVKGVVGGVLHKGTEEVLHRLPAGTELGQGVVSDGSLATFPISPSMIRRDILAS